MKLQRVSAILFMVGALVAPASAQVPGGGSNSGAGGTVSVSNFPATQPVSGAVTANLGTLNGAALDTSVQAVKTTLGSPFQAGASIGNTAFGISGQLPAFAATPTFNIGTAPTLSVQLADGADTTLGSKADAANAATGSSAMAIFRQLHADLIAATPAGTAIIGKVGIDQTTPGVTNAVTNSPSTGGTLTTSQPSVTTTAAALAFSGTVHREIYNPAASTASIFIGGSGVTTGNGWEIPPGASYDVSRFSGSVYAIAASSQTVRLISY